MMRKNTLEKQKCVQPCKHQNVLESVFKGLFNGALISIQLSQSSR